MLFYLTIGVILNWLQSTTVAPIPDEIMQSLPLLPLKEDVRTESGAPAQQRTLMKKKKDRRKLRHETWLKSTLAIKVH